MSLLYRAHPETVVSHHGCACERGAGNSAQCAHRGIDAANSRFPLESQQLIRHARLTHLGLDVIDEAELIDIQDNALELEYSTPPPAGRTPATGV